MLCVRVACTAKPPNTPLLLATAPPTPPRTPPTGSSHPAPQVYWNSRLQYEHARLANSICARKWRQLGASLGRQLSLGAGSGAEVPLAGDQLPVEGLFGAGPEPLGEPLGTGKSIVGAAAAAAASLGKRPSEVAAGHAGDAGGGSKKKARKGGKEFKDRALVVDPASGAGLVVADCMAGVGPFAVPLALRGCEVHANDLNPESFKWLEHNVAANKVLTGAGAGAGAVGGAEKGRGGGEGSGVSLSRRVFLGLPCHSGRGVGCPLLACPC